MKKILITGFEPFDIHDENPSERLARDLGKKLNLDFLVLPVSFARSVSIVEKQLKAINYDFILMLGLAAERSEICLERVALNWIDARIADVDGVSPQEESIDPGGEVAFISQLPLKKWIDSSEMIISNSAGTYVCNYLYYQMRQSSLGQNSLFVHVPSIESDAQYEKVKKQIEQLIFKINEEQLGL